MTYHECNSAELTTADSEAIRHMELSIASGTHWYIALLGAMGRWRSAEEVHNGRTYRYLIEGEAFDWLLLAERLCDAADGLLPVEEKSAFLVSGKPPLALTAEQIKELIGAAKYRQYLNYFYGITVEQALLTAVQEEIHKERHPFRGNNDTDEAYRRIYDETETTLLQRFRKEKAYPELESISLTEMKEFTYWLFKHRLKVCEKARVASDTKKALGYLTRIYSRRGIPLGLTSDGSLCPGGN